MGVDTRADEIRDEANEAVTALWCETHSEPLTADTRALLKRAYIAGRLAGVEWAEGTWSK